MQVVEGDWMVFPGGKLEKGPVYVSVVGEKIAGVSREAPSSDSTSLHAHVVTPGFVDLHTHGVGGSDDVINFWMHPEYSQRVFPKHGTTSFLASVVFPRTGGRTGEVLSRLGECVGRTGQGAVLEGVHAEGPVVHDLGAMPPADSEMSIERFEQLLDSIPSLRVMTISPRLEAKRHYQRMKALLKRGILPALGHDRVATETDILGALSLSPNRSLHITHLFNVCNFHHRSPSLVNFGLIEQFPRLPQYEGLCPPTVELVGDMVHVHPMTVAAVLKARHFRNICFVTDSVMEPKPGAKVKYMERQLQVSPDGKTLSLVGQETLAGSCCSQLDTLHSLVNTLEVPLGEAVAMLAENPARIVGLGHVGTIEAGKRADLLLLDQELNLQRTIIAGKTEFQKEQ